MLCSWPTYGLPHANRQTDFAVQEVAAEALQLQTDAATAAQVLQGIAHTTLPYYGVQFHPESIGTAYGRQLLQNFHDLTAMYHKLDVPEQLPPFTAGIYSS